MLPWPRSFCKIFGCMLKLKIGYMMQTNLEALEPKRAKGSLNAVSAVSPKSSAVVDETEIIVEVTMPEDATNGIFTVSHDAKTRLCLDAVCTADMDAYVIDNGTVAVAFADRNSILAGDTVASLRFKVLYRIEGEPQVTNTGISTDVPAGQFYTNAAYWALRAGITTFDPGAVVSWLWEGAP